jgi:hypothetical protein
MVHPFMMRQGREDEPWARRQEAFRFREKRPAILPWPLSLRLDETRQPHAAAWRLEKR